MRTRSVLLLLALAVAAAAPRASRAGDGARVASAPHENASYLPADDEGQHAAWDRAREAAARGDAVSAARELQRLAEGPAHAVTLVGAASGETGVAEGTRVAAHHAVVALGAAVAKAYEDEHGARARALVEEALALRDEARLARAADLYLPCAAGRRAALLLADLALERGDDDAALGWLDVLEDLEEVAAPDLADDVARWRRARLDRAAIATSATDAARPRVRAAIEAASPVAYGDGAAAPPADADLRRPPPPRAWPTTGGGPSRSAVVAPLPRALRFRAVEWLGEEPSEDPPGEADERGRAARPSPWIPTQGVVAGGRVWVSDGRVAVGFDLDTQQPVVVGLVPDAPPSPLPMDRGVAARERFGWIEGFGLTADGDVLYANVPAELTDPESADVADEGDVPPAVRRRPGQRVPPRPLSDRIVAVRTDEEGGRILWTAGGGAPTPGLPDGLRLFGTPLLYAGALHVVGLAPTAATKDRFDVFAVALDPATGAARWATPLGAGGPIRRKRFDEIMPASCAGAHGRVHVLTNLGIVATVDARTGATRWAYRYDRGRPDGDDTGQRLSDAKDPGKRRSSFLNRPPLVAHGRVFFAPTDGLKIVALFDRPRDRARVLEAWSLDRTGAFRNLAVEQLVGVVDGRGGTPATLVAVGQGWGLDPLHEPYTCVVGIDALSRHGAVRWERALPFGDVPEPFGTALVTEDLVYVPTASGIARYRVADGADVEPIDARAIPVRRAPLLYATERLWGNLVPVPGRGLVCVNEGYVSFWYEDGPP